MKVGSLVELVDDNWVYTNGAEIYPSKGKVYTVRDLLPKLQGQRSQDAVLLEEIVSPLVMYSNGIKAEPCFNVSRFRELMPPMKISIEQFKQEPCELV